MAKNIIMIVLMIVFEMMVVKRFVIMIMMMMMMIPAIHQVHIFTVGLASRRLSKRSEFSMMVVKITLP